MADLPSPNEGSEQEVSDDQSTIYEDDGRLPFILRLTPMEKYSMEDVKDWLDENFDFYVIAQESKPKLHYHVVVETELEDMRPLVQKFLYKYWPERPRGWGNAQYNLQWSTQPLRAISYVFKDKEIFFYKGYEEEFIDELRAKSFPKKSPNTFKLEYQELCNDYQVSDYDERWFMIKFIQLKAKYGQQVRLIDARAYALSNTIQRDPTTAEGIVEDYLYKI